MSSANERKSEAVVYTRVSTKEQTEGYSLEVQERACRRFADDRAYCVRAVFRDPGFTARNISRPGLEKMLEYVVEHKRRVAAVIIHKVDRLSRRGKDYHQLQAMLEALSIALLTSDGSVSETDEGIMVGGIHAVIAEYENRLRGRRSREGMIACVRDGRWAWRAPLGYVNSRDELGKAILIHDPERAALIARLFEEFSEGVVSYSDLAGVARAIGLRSRKGKQISADAIKDMLTNVVYYGETQGFGERRQGRHEPIASPSVLASVHRRLEKRRRAPVEYVLERPEFPLRRFVRCAVCGVPFTASWARSKTGKLYAYYRGRTPSCCGKSIRPAVLEEQFRALLSSVAPAPNIAETFSRCITEEYEIVRSTGRQRESQLRKRLKEIEERQHQLVDAHVFRGTISEEIFKRELEQLEKDEQSARDHIESIATEMPATPEVLRLACDCIADAEHVWVTAPPDLKRRFQTLVFPEGVTLRDGKFGTPTLSPIFELVGSYETSKEDMASPTGFEPVLPP